ncbi:ERAD-associated E3 ubiquitin-protein ligase HRD1B [Pleurostoma richardsiae]|uniref:RING-type E3 ubiquitin transferase n=1 Tax=Pleurostoma richardsiae TaxID=41990 RepID=A0AA38VRH4_9PEZI|nr:ERAD-associated E3 ubiquitin-protein ligase HRD1B [Pleurostoma richardsiae]
MRLAWYAGASTALAVGVITSAFYQRANFFSAMVYLSQSNLCLMILVNLVFLIYASFVYGLQRLCFGQLRPVEIEQLYEKAWFAVTETCLAMTVFREEVGAFFLVMFTALITGKVWGWIGEGRVEILEQQPPANPRLFHTRLTVSLVTSIIYNCWLLHFSVRTVVQQARPNMMVMFLFEFAILSISSVHTALRYILSLVEARVVKSQTHQRLEQRRSEIRAQRAEILRRREAGEEVEDELPNEEDVDEMDIEVSGWESKGQWVLSLDLLSDFLKLGIYAAFFFVLLMFYGLPIHIMRDLFMTTRSFVKRLGALLRYRQALRDMNNYPDATEEELSREDTCIICREEMRPWDPNGGQVERSRPKKLPCGHILHFGCLKSWLERQQVCPTCRRSVVVDNSPAARNRDAMVFRLGLNFPNAQNQQAQPNGAVPGGQPPQNGQNGQGGQQPANNHGGVRMFNIGPLRLGFAQGGVQEIQEMAQRMGVGGDVGNAQQPLPGTPQPLQAQNNDLSTMDAVRARLLEIDQRIQQEVRNVQNAQHELQILHLLIQELARIRQFNQQPVQVQGLPPMPAPAQTIPMAPPVAPAGAAAPQPPTANTQQPPFQMPAAAPLPPGQLPLPPFPQIAPFSFPQRFNSPGVSRHGVPPYATAIPAGSPELPEGVVIPPGWSLLPLQRLDGAGGAAQAAAPAASGSDHAQAPDTAQAVGQQAPSATQSSSNGTVSNGTSSAAHGQGANESEANGSSSSSQAPLAGQSQPAATAGGYDAQTEARREPPAVVAPVPIPPNWGGPAQLFGTGNGGMPFGLRPTPTSRPSSGQNGAATANGGAHQSADGAGDAPAAAAEGSRPFGSSSGNGEAAGGGGDAGASAKGKAPAVTVEDAEEDSE